MFRFVLTLIFLFFCADSSLAQDGLYHIPFREGVEKEGQFSSGGIVPGTHKFFDHEVIMVTHLTDTHLYKDFYSVREKRLLFKTEWSRAETQQRLEFKDIRINGFKPLDYKSAVILATQGSRDPVQPPRSRFVNGLSGVQSFAYTCDIFHPYFAWGRTEERPDYIIISIALPHSREIDRGYKHCRKSWGGKNKISVTAFALHPRGYMKRRPDYLTFPTKKGLTIIEDEFWPQFAVKHYAPLNDEEIMLSAKFFRYAARRILNLHCPKADIPIAKQECVSKHLPGYLKLMTGWPN